MPQRTLDARMLRALIATLVVIGLGHTAHSLGGATGPQPLAVGVLAALVGPLVWALVRRGASATRLGVARRTVDSWRGRGTKGDPFPEPRWTVGGRPAWNWDDVERWHATRTN